MELSLELEKRVKAGINFRSLHMEVRKAEKTEDDTYIVEGYATTFDDPYILYEWEDSGEKVRILEQVDKEAFKECDLSDVIMQYDHQGRVYARTGNGTLELIQDNHGLLVRANLGGTSEGKKLYEEIKGGYTTKMSFGFTIKDEERLEKRADDGAIEILYTIKSIGKLYDVSAVSLPANDGTEISARTRFDAEVEKRKAEAEKQKEATQKQDEERAKEKELKERERLSLELSFSL
mgnify:CR=1 FL=1